MPKSDHVPACPSIPAVRSLGQEAREYQIELITPMFGGGVEPGVNDSSFPIRPTAIRGQLRYWWRLTRGLSLGAGMWRREEEIFGSTEFPSPVEICVSNWSKPDLVAASVFDRFGPEAYALFAAVEGQHNIVRHGLKFTLTVKWPTVDELKQRRKAQNRSREKTLPSDISDLTPDIETAFAAWLTLGGLGARTRRGCGAVRCDKLTLILPPKLAVGVRVFLGPPQGDSMSAWHHSVLRYRNFRQTPRGKKHKKTIQTRNGPKVIQVPGRSHWPEPDSIRKLTGCSLKPPNGTSPSGVPADEDTRDHSVPIVPANLLPAFPKAMLGLPINFHFADGPGKHAPGQANLDPQDVELRPLDESMDRMASPVVTRPLFVDGKWHPAVVILDPQLPENFQARLVGPKAKAGGGRVNEQISASAIQGDDVAKLETMRGQKNALDALAVYLLQVAKYEEVTP